MPNNQRYGYPLCLALVIGLSASTAALANDVKVTKLATLRSCGSQQGLSLISDAGQAAKQLLPIAQTISRHKPDWKRVQLLLINMGQQANMGYSLDYQAGANVEAQVLQVPIQWNIPQPGRMYAQMIVSPCLLLSVPRQGYRSIEVRDQTGQLRGSLANVNH
ncbi:MAG: protease complex subunit PrcB family protein [Gammaproteobacteria bacterium]|nr:protease complex subunit PrcB family protein [Gammaproteobacteria bacterium]